MEKIDVLFAGFIISIIIFTINIIAIKIQLNLMHNIIESQTDIINDLVKSCDASVKLHMQQTKINERQTNFNDNIVNALIGSSPTGGRRSEAEAQS